jgi:3',5'-cyclic AMP phosphodiesterase CpdA
MGCTREITIPLRGDPSERLPDETINAGLDKLILDENSFNFYVIGDWGRNGYYKQAQVAHAMNLAAFVIEPDVIVSTGDNFYESGVASVQDPYFRSSFEDIYDGANLFVPWYLVLGNHDYKGNPQAQIEYTEISQRWKMPDRYFYFDQNDRGSGLSARFIFIDTSPFEDNYYTGSFKENIVSQDSTAQKNWLEQTLKSSQADWNIVIGHHPFYTSGHRIGRDSDTRSHLEELFQKYKVDAYFAGHEHDLQHQKPDAIHTHHFISGAGSRLRPTGQMEYTRFAESTNGFMIASLSHHKLRIQAVSWEGKVLYQTEILKTISK